MSAATLRAGRVPAMRTLLVLALTLLATLTAGNVALAENVQQRLTNLEPQYMCISCHEPLNQVNSAQAQAEKQTLAGFVAKGLSDSQVKTAMVNQYGTGVLSKPPATGLNLTVYILPPAVLVAGLLLLIYTLPKWRARAKARAGEPLESADALAPDDAHRLDDELAKFI